MAHNGFSLATQNKLVYALAAVHNWMNSHGANPRKEWKDLEAERKRGIDSERMRAYLEILEQQEVTYKNREPANVRDGRLMNAVRDEIAQKMWDVYQRLITAANPNEGNEDISSDEFDSGYDD